MPSANRWLAFGAAVGLAFAVGCEDNATVQAPDLGDAPLGESVDETDEPDTEDRVVVIGSGDVARLYEVVNDPAYAGYTVQLESGTYPLNRALDANGTGHLVLQPGMTLIGSNEYRDHEDAEGNAEADGVWDPWDRSADAEQFPDPETETLIDFSEIGTPDIEVVGCGESPSTIDVEPAGILLAPGSAVRRATLEGYRTAPLVALEVRGPDTDGVALSAEVSDCVLRDAARGVEVRTLGCESAGREGVVTLEGNVVTGNESGLRIANTLTRDATLEVALLHNRFWRNDGEAIWLQAGESAEGSRARVESEGNMYEENSGGGMVIFGHMPVLGIYPAAATGGLDNEVVWTSRGDRIVDNGTPGSYYSWAGMNIGGGVTHDDVQAVSARNRAEISIFDTVFASSHGRGNHLGFGSNFRCDLWVSGFVNFGRRVDRPNTVVLRVEGSRSDGTPVYIDHSYPDDPEDENRVEIVGGEEAILEQNEGIDGVALTELRP